MNDGSYLSEVDRLNRQQDVASSDSAQDENDAVVRVLPGPGAVDQIFGENHGVARFDRRIVHLRTIS